jgi:hypothetical protein
MNAHPFSFFGRRSTAQIRPELRRLSRRVLKRNNYHRRSAEFFALNAYGQFRVFPRRGGATLLLGVAGMVCPVQFLRFHPRRTWEHRAMISHAAMGCSARHNANNFGCRSVHWAVSITSRCCSRALLHQFGGYMTTCPACATALPDGARFCPRCGQNLSSHVTSLIPAPRSSVIPPPPATPYSTYTPQSFGVPVPPLVISISTKSVGTAILLAALFGPLGMFYSTVGGATIMCIVSFFVLVGTFGFGILITWPICIIWAAVAADTYNKQLVNRRYI